METKGIGRNFFASILGGVESATLDTIGALGGELGQRQNLRNLIYYGTFALIALSIFKK